MKPQKTLNLLSKKKSIIIANRVYLKNGYFKESLSFSFKSKKKKAKLLTWHYKRFLSCDSKDVFYVFIWNNSDFFYNGQTENDVHENINQI